VTLGQVIYWTLISIVLYKMAVGSGLFHEAITSTEFLERRVSTGTRRYSSLLNTHGEDLRTERMARQSAASMLATAALLLGVFANIAPSIYIFPLSLLYVFRVCLCLQLERRNQIFFGECKLLAVT